MKGQLFEIIARLCLGLVLMAMMGLLLCALMVGATRQLGEIAAVSGNRAQENSGYADE